MELEEIADLISSVTGMSWVFSPTQGYIPIQADHLKMPAQVSK